MFSKNLTFARLTRFGLVGWIRALGVKWKDRTFGFGLSEFAAI